jgi:hypothetical protein
VRNKCVHASGAWGRNQNGEPHVDISPGKSRHRPRRCFASVPRSGAGEEGAGPGGPAERIEDLRFEISEGRGQFSVIQFSVFGQKDLRVPLLYLGGTREEEPVAALGLLLTFEAVPFLFSGWRGVPIVARTRRVRGLAHEKSLAQGLCRLQWRVRFGSQPRAALSRHTTPRSVIPHWLALGCTISRLRRRRGRNRGTTSRGA